MIEPHGCFAFLDNSSNDDTLISAKETNCTNVPSFVYNSVIYNASYVHCFNVAYIRVVQWRCTFNLRALELV